MAFKECITKAIIGRPENSYSPAQIEGTISTHVHCRLLNIIEFNSMTILPVTEEDMEGGEARAGRQSGGSIKKEEG